MKPNRTHVMTYAAFFTTIMGVVQLFNHRLAVASPIDLQHHSPRVVQATTLEPAPATSSEEMPREWSFVVDRYAIDHQGPNTLKITVRCTYDAPQTTSPFPDSATVYRDITHFLEHYPNETDYWEVVNRNLTSDLLQRYPTLTSITANLEVLPMPSVPYTRSTTVTRIRNGETVESWSFITAQVATSHRGGHTLNIDVNYRYRDGTANSQYPNFIPIYGRIAEFLQRYPNDTDSWETVNQQLADMVLREYPVMESLTSQLEVLPSKQLPYHYFTAVTRSQADRSIASRLKL